LVADLLSLLKTAEIDMTLFYRGLADLDINDAALSFEMLLHASSYAPLNDEVKKLAESWLTDYLQRLKVDGRPNQQRRAAMNAVNPKYVLRNYLAQLAIDQAENGDFSGVRELLNVLRRPYEEQEAKQQFAEKRPEWAKQRAGCSMLSCSS